MKDLIEKINEGSYTEYEDIITDLEISLGKGNSAETLLKICKDLCKNSNKNISQGMMLHIIVALVDYIQNRI